ncbi:uncharacterized protein LOC122702672 [Cervus elaphus]|uniref:uncharacterized protein LOC122702672 n=1 Tax=Cervus elaphus TaxID=9860 RepID=UPI001CC306A4|nr:uncharacterized protein LOC122702672 [Cervus elaphus]
MELTSPALAGLKTAVAKATGPKQNSGEACNPGPKTRARWGLLLTVGHSSHPSSPPSAVTWHVKGREGTLPGGCWASLPTATAPAASTTENAAWNTLEHKCFLLHELGSPGPGTEIHLLSPCICLLWTFHINGITQHVTFCDWLLSLASCFQDSPTSWPVSAVHSCLWPNDTSLNKYTTICLSTQQLMDIWVVSTFWSMPGSWGGLGEGSGQAQAGLPLPSPSSASSESPPHSLQGSARNPPLAAPSPWSVGGGLHLLTLL